MIVHVLACDYDGTIADDGRLAPETAAVLARVRESGRRLFLVTGRMLDDLERVCPDVDRLFDLVVAENGGLPYLPEQRAVRRLGDSPEPALIEALRRHGVPFEVGASILATTAAYSDTALAAIRETGVERSLVFNKGALMLLPGGVTKGTGLAAALDLAQLSAHNLAGVGDAENDHAFLAMCECAAAVADAVPALRERADVVTAAAGAAGAREFAEQYRAPRPRGSRPTSRAPRPPDRRGSHRRARRARRAPQPHARRRSAGDRQDVAHRRAPGADRRGRTQRVPHRPGRRPSRAERAAARGRDGSQGRPRAADAR